MKIGEATFIAPSSSAALERANQVERALLECEEGQWLPVEMEKPGQAQALVTAMKGRGFAVKRNKLVVFVRAGSASRPHVHVFKYATGITNAAAADGVCVCGEVKKASAEPEPPLGEEGDDA